MAAGGVRLLVGPARLVVRAGRVVVLGHELGPGEEVVAPAGRSVPILLDSAMVDVTPGPDRLAPGDERVYRAMEEAARRLAGAEPPVLLVGPSDAGKSTLAAWAAVLASKALGEAWLLEADVGQNEVYAPGFEALARVEPPFVPGWDRGGEPLRCFTGSFTPSRSLHRYLSCAARLSRAARGGYLVVDTDGWVEAWDGLASKAALAHVTGARTIAHVGLGEAASRALEAMVPDAAHVRLPRLSPTAKTRGERRLHRNRLIALRLAGARARPVRLHETPVTGLPMGMGAPLDPSQLEALGLPPRLVERAEVVEGRIHVVARRRLRTPPGVKLYEAGGERGLLASIHDPTGQQHVAVVEKVNYRTGTVTVHTSHQGPARLLEVGEARVEWPPKY